MPRIRSVKPEFFTSEPVNACSMPAQLLFIGLWTHSDDEGRSVDNVRVLKGALFPLNDEMTPNRIESGLVELARQQLIVRYSVERKRYIVVRNFKEHQHPKKPTPSKIPPPPEMGMEKNANTPQGHADVATVSSLDDDESTGGEGVPTGVPREIRDGNTGPEPVPHQFPTSSPPVPMGEEGSRSSRRRGVGEERSSPATRVAQHEIVQHPATAKAQIVVPVIQGFSAAVLPAAASVGPITPPCDTAGEFDYSAIRTPPMAADAHHVFDLADDEDGDNASDIAPAPLADRDSAPVAQTVMDVLVHGEEGAVEVPKRAIKASRGAKHGRTDGTKFPYFSSALRGQLIDVWKKGVRPLAEGEYGKIFKYFGPFFQLPEAERPVDDPRDDEVIAALREILVARKYAQGGDKFSEPQIAAEKITPVVEILRECQFDAAARMERIDRVLGLRSVHKASHAR